MGVVYNYYWSWIRSASVSRRCIKKVDITGVVERQELGEQIRQEGTSELDDFDVERIVFNFEGVF